MTSGTKPRWAFSIWCDSDWIHAELPNINGHQSHTIKVANSSAGLNKLLVLVRARHTDSVLGDKGDPTQHQISNPKYDESMVRRVGRIKINYTPQQRSTTREILRKMGLI